MIRLVAALLLWMAIAIAPASAQPVQPLVTSELSATEAIPGQPIRLTVTVLVPTFMPEAPGFPSFETPNVMVRMTFSGPATGRVEGETWSGVRRTYQIFPMTPGRFVIPSQDIQVTYADPDTRAPVRSRVRLEPLTFFGVRPEGAEDLDPFIAASDLRLSQDIEGAPDAMEPGAAVTRRITAEIAGAPAVFIPPLIEAARSPAIAAYGAEPIVEERNVRGRLTGSRTDTVTYVAEAGGRLDLPPVTLRWYNLNTGRIDVSQLDGVALISRGPAPSRPPVDRGKLALEVVGWGAVLAIVLIVVRQLRTRIAAGFSRLKAAWLRSEPHAFQRAREAVNHRALLESLKTIRAWLAFWPQRADESEDSGAATLERPLARIGAAAYGPQPQPAPQEDWRQAREALNAERRRRTAGRRARRRNPLPPLNP